MLLVVALVLVVEICLLLGKEGKEMADKDLFEGLHATTRREAFSGMLEDFRSFSEDRTFKSFREFIKSSVNRFQDVGMVNLPAYAYESEIDARIYTIALEQVFNREFPVSKIQDK